MAVYEQCASDDEAIGHRCGLAEGHRYEHVAHPTNAEIKASQPEHPIDHRHPGPMLACNVCQDARPAAPLYWTETWRARQATYGDELTATAEGYRNVIALLAEHGPKRGAFADRSFLRGEAERLDRQAEAVYSRLNELALAYGPARFVQGVAGAMTTD